MKLDAGTHGTVIGRTGAGKTYYMVNFLAPISGRTLIVDSEGYDYDKPWFPTISFSKARELSDGDKPFVARVLSTGKMDSKVDDLFYALLDKGHELLLLIDEATDFSRGETLLPGYFDLIRKARKRQISVWSGTQRPADLNKTVYTQSSHHVWFYVDEYDVANWLHRSAQPVFDRMSEIPYGSFRWLYQAPSGQVELYDKVPEYHWGDRYARRK